MARTLTSFVGPEALAVMSGTFLSGAMLNISVLVMPVLRETSGGTSKLLDQWARVYAYGLRMMPALAIGTCMLYGAAVLQRQRQRQRQLRGMGTGGGAMPKHFLQERASGRIFVLAAIITLGMVPFTWFVMAPTNTILFQAQEDGGTIGWEAATALLTRWTLLHSARAAFPLVGAAVGLVGTLREVEAKTKAV